jgi:hypothetical protein
MMRLVAIAALLAGCDLYFGGGGGGGDDIVDPPCERSPQTPPVREARNPHTGQCTAISGGGGWCDDRCIPCDDVSEPPDWGACYSHCDGLAETACFATSGCYAAYLDDATDAQVRTFWGCWNTAPSGPVQGGGCGSLDAYACSRHDDCSAVYADESTAFNGTAFLQCVPEAATFCVDNDDCGTGTCDTSTCYPSPTCPSCPTCGACPDSNTCYGVCVPTDPAQCATLTTESACRARSDCRAVYDGQDCTCTPSGCACQILTYERCEAL